MTEKEHDRKVSAKSIDKTMLIAEIVDEFPDAIPLLIEKGMHCIGCGAAMFETLEEGFMAHGMDTIEIDKIVDELNNSMKKNHK
jgi:hybrid cluster-associated redox disulfide protein